MAAVVMAKWKPAAYCSDCGAEAAPERGTAGPQVIRHRSGCSVPTLDAVQEAHLEVGAALLHPLPDEVASGLRLALACLSTAIADLDPDDH